MASPAQKLTLGPWARGLVLYDTDEERDTNSLPDGVQKLVNLDVTNEGYLRARPGAQRVGEVDVNYAVAEDNRTCRVLGTVFENNALQAVLGIHSNYSGDNRVHIYLSPDGYQMNHWGIAFFGDIKSVQQYNNVIYLLPGSEGEPVMGYQIPSGNFFTYDVDGEITGSSYGTETAITAPAGDKSFIFKDRMFIVDFAGSTVHFSAPTDPTDYTVINGGGYFEVNPSDDIGSGIHDVAMTTESFYIFKRTQTYLFAYDVNPNDDGILRLVNSALGAFSATIWENDVYVVNTQGVYRIVNAVFVRLDETLNLRRNVDLASSIDPMLRDKPLFIHAFGKKLIVGQFPNRVLSKYGWNYVVMNLNNGAWTGYKFYADGGAPGGQGTTAQADDMWGSEIFPSKNEKYFIRMNLVPGPSDYTLDGHAADVTERRYIPPFNVKFNPYNAGFSSLWKKIHRHFLRGSILYPDPGFGPVLVPPTITPIYDKSDSVMTLSYDWDQADPIVANKSQSEIKLPIPQQRCRNVTIEINSDGENTGRLWGSSATIYMEDDFNRANGWPDNISSGGQEWLAQWHSTDGSGVVSNRFRLTSGDAGDGAWTELTFYPYDPYPVPQPDMIVEATWVTISSAPSTYHGMRFRHADPVVPWGSLWVTSTDLIFVDGVTPTDFYTHDAPGISAGDTVTVICRGPQIIVIANGVTINSQTLAEAWETQFGFSFFHNKNLTSLYYDEWDNVTISGFPEVPTEADAEYDVLISEFALDLSFPKGMSHV